VNDPPLERRPLYGIEGVRLRRLFNYTTSGGLEADSSSSLLLRSVGVQEFRSSVGSILWRSRLQVSSRGSTGEFCALQ